MFSNRPALTTRAEIALDREPAAAAGSASGSVTADVYYIRDRVQRKLLAETDGGVTIGRGAQVRQMIETFFNQVLAEENLLYTRADRARLLEWVLADITGYGPLEPLLQDESITEVMVNGHGNVYVERFGKIEKTNVVFENNDHLLRIIERIVSPLGRRVDESSPTCRTGSASTSPFHPWRSTARRSPSASSPRPPTPCRTWWPTAR
jgi:pilus assembly protein CpaF